MLKACLYSIRLMEAQRTGQMEMKFIYGFEGIVGLGWWLESQGEEFRGFRVRV